MSDRPPPEVLDAQEREAEEAVYAEERRASAQRESVENGEATVFDEFREQAEREGESWEAEGEPEAAGELPWRVVTLQFVSTEPTDRVWQLCHGIILSAASKGLKFSDGSVEDAEVVNPAEYG